MCVFTLVGCPLLLRNNKGRCVVQAAWATLSPSQLPRVEVQVSQQPSLQWHRCSYCDDCFFAKEAQDHLLADDFHSFH